jgi:UDP-glucose 4-epimerase
MLRRLMGGGLGQPARVVVLSRDETKQHALRLRYMRQASATDEVIYRETARRLEFRIGDVRDLRNLSAAVNGMDVVVHAAAMKQVPTCEYFPEEAVRTNVLGAVNLVEAVRQARRRPEAVIGISTDKAVKPVNVMGMTKALQERVIARAAMEVEGCRFALVRYGNVIASRGSVVPLFLDQIATGGPVTITHPGMTRFLATLDDAVDAIAAAYRDAASGETLVPILPAARVTDIARALIGSQPVEMRVTGIRPGEKMHEILISEEERIRSYRRGGYLVIGPVLPELRQGQPAEPELSDEYSSAAVTLDVEGVSRLLAGVGISSGAPLLDPVLIG